MKFVWKLNNCLQLSNFALNSLLFVLCLVAGKRLGAQASTVLTVSDTRSGDSVPKAYKRVARLILNIAVLSMLREVAPITAFLLWLLGLMQAVGLPIR